MKPPRCRHCNKALAKCMGRDWGRVSGYSVHEKDEYTGQLLWVDAWSNGYTYCPMPGPEMHECSCGDRHMNYHDGDEDYQLHEPQTELQRYVNEVP